MLLLTLLFACKTTTDADPKVEQITASEPTKLPMAQAASVVEIAPVGPEDLQPYAAGPGTGLRALMVGPLSEQDSPRQALVVFDRPMVPLANLDRDPVPLSCEGQAGTGRWAGTSTAVFVPDAGNFPKNSEIRCSVPAGTAAADGTKLEEAVEFSFATARPELTRSTPSSGASSVDPSETLVLVFNQPVDPKKVLKHLTLRASSKKVKLKLADVPEEGTRLPKDRSRVVSFSAELERDSDYQLILTAGLPALEGTRGSATETVIDFSTIPPAAITDVYPTGGDVSPYNQIRLDLATNTEGEALNERISIEPTPPDGWAPAEDYSWSRWSHGVRLEPMTTYTVTVEPGGKDAYGQEYTEGKQWAFTTGHLNTMVDAASGRLLYPANNPTELPTRSRNVKDLYVAVTPVDAAWAMESFDGYSAFDSDKRTFQTPGVPVAVGREMDEKVHSDTLDLAPYLQDGKGLLFVETWSPEYTGYRDRVNYQKALLQVTDLATTLKVDHTGVQTWVTRLSDGAPVPEAQVRVYYKGSMAWEGQTDAQGMVASSDIVPPEWEPWDDAFFVMVEKEGDRVITTSQRPHRRDTWSFGISTGQVAKGETLSMSAFSDRGVYKPGDTVHIAAKARVETATGMDLPTQGKLSWSCEDARGSELTKGSRDLDTHAGAAFDLTLPKDMPTGEGYCSLELKSDQGKTSEWVPLRVYAYRAPSFRVEVSAASNAIQGEALSAVGHGNYLFGAPMGGAKATWTARAMEIQPDIPGWDGFTFGGDESQAWWEYDAQPINEIASGEASLNSEGSVPIKVELPKAGEEARTQTIEIEVQVQDQARQRVANRTHVTVHPAEFYLGLKAASGVGQAGQEFGVDIIAADPQGQAIPKVTAEIEVVRRTWDVIRQKGMDGRYTWVSTPNDSPVTTLKEKTASQQTRVNFTPEQAGYYVLRASAQDSAGRSSVSEMGLYVAGPNATWARGDDDTVELVADKRSYAPGETAKILVKAPKAGMYALITTEREGVLSRRVTQLEEAAASIEIPLTEEHAPNIFVSVVLTEGAPPADSPSAGMPAHYLGYTELKVSAESRHLSVDLGTDQQSYQPGQQVTVNLKASQGDTPAAGARVVLYAVDHGVLSLTDYQTPNPYERFWGPRSLHVLTADARTQILDRAALLAKGAPAGGDGGSDSMRSRFETTPLWEAELETDENGVLVHSFTLPDNLTTFRLMAVVDHGEQAFGNAESELQVSRPLLANPALPRFLRDGDQALAGVVVHNNREKEATVLVNASATGLSLSGSPQTVTVPAGGAVEVPFALTDALQGQASLEFSVSAGEDQDQVRVALPIAPRRPVETMATAGVADAVSEQPVERPEGALPDVGSLEVSVSPTALVGAESSLDYLLEYPHGCLEQTSSRMLAAILAKDLDKQLDLGHSAEEIESFRAAGLARIALFEHYSGGYSMWAGSREASPMATAYVLEALHRAGEPIRPESVSFLRDFLGGAYTPSWWDKDTTRAAHARVALSLARIGQGDSALNSNLYTERNKLPMSARAGLAEAIARTTGADARTSALLRELEGHLEIQASYAVITQENASRWVALWEGNATPTAATVRALLVADPQNPLLVRLVQGLVASRRDGRWGNTYTTLSALSALVDYAEQFEDGSLAQSVRVTLGSKELLAGDFEGATPKRASLPMSALQAGQLSIQPQGRVYWEAHLSYGLQNPEPRDEGFTVQRTMVILEGTGHGDTVTPGALVEVTLQITTPVERSFVAIVDPLPAGLESVNTAFATTASALGDDGGQDSGYYYGGWDTAPPAERTWSDWVFNHRELLDDRVVLYADWMPAGVHRYTYVARATTPGTYTHPAAMAEQMYAPEVFGRTGGGTFVVGSPPVAQN
jgi:uncharacterized protein YfaS (alpha-2-macroglobulin family)